MTRHDRPPLTPSRRRAELARIAKFALVGLSTTLLYGVFAYGAARTGLVGPFGASSLGYLGAFAVSYLGHLHFSFAVAPDHRRQFWRFAVVTATTFAITLALTWLVVRHLGRPYWVSVVVVMIAIPPASYLLNRFWVFTTGAPDA